MKEQLDKLIKMKEEKNAKSKISLDIGSQTEKRVGGP